MRSDVSSLLAHLLRRLRRRLLSLPRLKTVGFPEVSRESSYTLQRVVDYCEGWLPRIRQPERLAQKMAELRARADKAGRDMQTISVSVFGATADPQQLDTYRAIGVTRALLGLPSADRDTVLPLLDQYAQLLR